MNLFKLITVVPWPFLILVPAVLVVFLAVGWTRSDIIEQEVANIWIPQRGKLARNKQYASDIGFEGFSSGFAAMAISRDGKNLLKEDRLEEIRARMEAAESTTVVYNNITFTYEDVCASNSAGIGTTYEFPCLRVSPLDLYQEAQWYFEENDRVTWYDVNRKFLVKPRLPRFGIMQGVCSSAGGNTSQSDVCDHQLALRQNATYAVENGFPASYANPFALFSDIGAMELNNPCRLCIEEGFESTMQFLTRAITGMFQVMFAELRRFRLDGDLTDPVKIDELDVLIGQVGAIVQSMDRNKVEEFYFYYVLRGLYAELGAESYVANYAEFMGLLGGVCQLLRGGDANCPATVTVSEAAERLLKHADNTFSSVTTAGNPFPFWSEGNGTGALFAGDLPVGGSGVDMSGNLLSSTLYMDLENVGEPEWSPLYTNGAFMDPVTPDPRWTVFVESDPIYKWFIAEQTPMTSHCGNGNLTGTKTGIAQIDTETSIGLATAVTQRWCTKFSVPNEVDGTVNKQHFAKMWYELLIDSGAFLGITQGVSDPYVWTSGNGCGYTLGGSRYSYTNQTEKQILNASSRLLYTIDEGVSAGAIDRNLIIGGATPAIGKADYSNPLETVSVLQNLYVLLRGEAIPDRVRNCNRPGGPINITTEDAEQILYDFKKAFEENWVAGWDDPNNGEVQFVGFFDDRGGAIGTTGRLLTDITLDNGRLTAISIVVIALFSALFLFSFDLVESRVMLTLIGVILVIVSFFAALGFGILLGIKVNVNIAWTLPFIIIGLGVDDMYIVMLDLKKQKDYSTESFLRGMKEVVVPVTMTSLVNAAMFAIMNIVDIPAVYKTAQMALIAVIFLYLTIVFAFPAYCYLDMKRQEAGRYDILVCVKEKEDSSEDGKHSERQVSNGLYEMVYKPLVLSSSPLRYLSHAVIFLAGIAVFGVGIYGVTERQVGLGLEDFFPSFHQANVWATVRTEELASWSMGMSWGAIDYGKPESQMGMIRQFEEVVASPHVAEIDTKQLWMARFLIWTSRQCSTNFDRDDGDVLECGRDQIWPEDDSTCSGYWVYNSIGLREKAFSDGVTCTPNEGGICRPTSQMHPQDLLDLGINPRNPTNLTASWCPVFSGWSDEKFAFCLRRWSNFTGGGGGLLTVEDTATENPTCSGDYYSDSEIEVPIRLSQSPTMFALDLFSHDDTIDLIKETRVFCDDDESLHCWLSGIPYDYWEQYLWVEDVLVEVSGAAIGIGFLVAFSFLVARLTLTGNHPVGKIVVGSFVGALLIALTSILCLVPVVGLSVLADVNITAFSDMSFVLSIGFAVEYSVHVVHRFLDAPLSYKSATDRVHYAMSFLTLPTFLSFVSSTIGVVCLAFTDFNFNEVFFFRPLIIVMFVTYFFGCWFLPVVLSALDFSALKLGDPDENSGVEKPKEIAEEVSEMEDVVDISESISA